MVDNIKHTHRTVYFDILRWYGSFCSFSENITATKISDYLSPSNLLRSSGQSLLKISIFSMRILRLMSFTCF